MKRERNTAKTRVSLKSFINRTIQFIYPNRAYRDDCYSCASAVCIQHAFILPLDMPATSVKSDAILPCTACLILFVCRLWTHTHTHVYGIRTLVHKSFSPFHLCGVVLLQTLHVFVRSSKDIILVVRRERFVQYINSTSAA